MRLIDDTTLYKCKLFKMVEEQHQFSMVQRNSWSIVNHYTVKEGMNDLNKESLHNE
jgi:hypothetical protein